MLNESNQGIDLREEPTKGFAFLVFRASGVSVYTSRTVDWAGLLGGVGVLAGVRMEGGMGVEGRGEGGKGGNSCG